ITAQDASHHCLRNGLLCCSCNDVRCVRNGLQWRTRADRAGMAGVEQKQDLSPLGESLHLFRELVRRERAGRARVRRPGVEVIGNEVELLVDHLADACVCRPACSTRIAVSTLSSADPCALLTKAPSWPSKPTTTRT